MLLKIQFNLYLIIISSFLNFFENLILLTKSESLDNILFKFSLNSLQILILLKYYYKNLIINQNLYFQKAFNLNLFKKAILV
jgi:hypothetical protein